MNAPQIRRDDYNARLSMISTTHEDPLHILKDLRDELAYDYGPLWNNDRHALKEVSTNPRYNKIFSVKINGKSCIFSREFSLAPALHNCKVEEIGDIVFNIYLNNKDLFHEKEFLSDLIFIAGRFEIENSKAIWRKFKNEEKNVDPESYKELKEVCLEEIPWGSSDSIFEEYDYD